MTIGECIPPGVDVNEPSVARVYDFLLGGKDNFAVDREAAAAALQAAPDWAQVIAHGREFLGRVVRHLVATAGIRQILDVGCGLPAPENVHEIAHRIDPSVRVAYVDNDPMVLAHGRARLAHRRTAAMFAADLRRPSEILESAEVRRFLDFTRPVGLLLLSVLHHLDDAENPPAVVAELRDALPAGSVLAIAHFHNPGIELPEVSSKAFAIERAVRGSLGTGRWRDRDEIRGYFGDFTLLDPGLVPLPLWRPEAATTPTRSPAQTEPPPHVVGRHPIPAQAGPFNRPVPAGTAATVYTLVGGVARKP